MKETCYIAGAIASLPKPIAMKNFEMAAARMQMRGYKTVNPFDLKPVFGIRRWFFFMLTDLWHLRTRCKVAYFQSNWRQSPGACIERACCLKWNIKIIDHEKIDTR